ncbi:alpha/beta hydrolase [Mycolicibacterium sp. 018/SC-01/001]|uniref:alpha/beta hydrolase n=1 Tax=Mycolicibacterium sp. 018/SC-01/001 TaxID=2592069 RepID=UPI00117C9E91|nr:alpha/beta hydrolase [Mycolicibacterium sp. 018/SC-01/001]TRW78516.1 alpha/beta hydrolase [Mycolicibacterium sp. 018/SC-01/001]
MRFPRIVGRTTVIDIPTRHGPVGATVYRPDPRVHRPAVYVNIHGGGFVVGHREQDDPWCRYLADAAGVVVVNTDYLLAPRHRFPVAAEQIYDVVRWATDDARDWDGTRLAVGGQSAGGNLAAAAARQALDHRGPRIGLQVLHYPPLDLVTEVRDKPSPLGGRAVMKPWMGQVFDNAYVPDRRRRRDPLVSPAWGANADDIIGIAPAVVVTAEYDRLRDEARRYADRLGAAGSLVDYIEVPGADHGYNIMSDAGSVTERVYAQIAEHVARVASP